MSERPKPRGGIVRGPGNLAQRSVDEEHLWDDIQRDMAHVRFDPDKVRRLVNLLTAERDAALGAVLQDKQHAERLEKDKAWLEQQVLDLAEQYNALREAMEKIDAEVAVALGRSRT